MSDPVQIPVQTVRTAVPTIVQGGSCRHSVVAEHCTVEQAPWAIYAARDTHRDTIGRDEFLQLRLPLVGLMDADEIEEILDTVRGSGDVVLNGLQIVDDLSTTSPTAGRQTHAPTPTPTVPSTAINSVPASPTLQRRPRTSRSAARSSAPELPFLDMLGEEEGGEEGDENEAGVRSAHRSSWRRGFKAVFKRGRGRI